MYAQGYSPWNISLLEIKRTWIYVDLFFMKNPIIARRIKQLMVIEITVLGQPPYKQTHADDNQREQQKERSKALKDEARKICKSVSNSEVSLDIKYLRYKGRADPANIIGGIADTLQGIAYVNDRQVKTIHYSETKGGKDEYTVSIKVKEE